MSYANYKKLESIEPMCVKKAINSYEAREAMEKTYCENSWMSEKNREKTAIREAKNVVYSPLNKYFR